jgi:hypothetical protein
MRLVALLGVAEPPALVGRSHAASIAAPAKPYGRYCCWIPVTLSMSVVSQMPESSGS